MASPSTPDAQISRDKTVSFPSQSIFARPTHSRVWMRGVNESWEGVCFCTTKLRHYRLPTPTAPFPLLSTLLLFVLFLLLHELPLAYLYTCMLVHSPCSPPFIRKHGGGRRARTHCTSLYFLKDQGTNAWKNHTRGKKAMERDLVALEENRKWFFTRWRRLKQLRKTRRINNKVDLGGLRHPRWITWKN